MRYILAAVSLVISLVFFGLGIAQRTVWAPPETITSQVQDAVDTPVLVIDGSVLGSNDGRQTIQVAGDGPMTLVYGRTNDVLGWIGDASYSSATIDESTGDLALDVTEGSESTVPAIAGSDLWIAEESGEGSLDVTVDLPADVTVAIVSDGTAPAPSDVRVVWPYSATTPLFGPFVTTGFVFLALALLFLLLGLRNHRRKRGPQRQNALAPTRRERRELQRSSKRGLPLAPPVEAIEPATSDDSADAASIESGTTPEIDPADASDAAAPDATSSDAPRADGADGKARSRATRQQRGGSSRGMRWVAPLALVSIALTGCSAEYWPSATEAPATDASATPTPTSLEDTLPDPAVTEPQFERILDATRETLTTADASLDAEAAATRLGGAALNTVSINYQVRATDGTIAAYPGIPDGDVELLLPQQNESWPRTVMAVVGWTDGTAAQSALFFEQASPRENYRLMYMDTLESGIQLPEVASHQIGAASLPGTTPLLQVPPADVTAAYADVLLNGDASASASMFDHSQDTLYSSFGPQYKADLVANPDYALSNIAFTNAADDMPEAVLATNDGGAIVATSFTETETLTPKEEGVTIDAKAGPAVLAGVAESATGISTTYQMQVLLYIPPADAPEGTQVTVLGYGQSLLASQEVAAG